MSRSCSSCSTPATSSSPTLGALPDRNASCDWELAQCRPGGIVLTCRGEPAGSQPPARAAAARSAACAPLNNARASGSAHKERGQFTVSDAELTTQSRPQPQSPPRLSGAAAIRQATDSAPLWTHCRRSPRTCVAAVLLAATLGRARARARRSSTCRDPAGCGGVRSAIAGIRCVGGAVGWRQGARRLSQALLSQRTTLRRTPGCRQARCCCCSPSRTRSPSHPHLGHPAA
jgi:hypothetical protein